MSDRYTQDDIHDAVNRFNAAMKHANPDTPQAWIDKYPASGGYRLITIGYTGGQSTPYGARRYPPRVFVPMVNAMTEAVRRATTKEQ